LLPEADVLFVKLIELRRRELEKISEET